MKEFDLLIKNGTCAVNKSGNTCLEVTDIAIKNGKIADIGQLEGNLAAEVLDAGGLHVLPGLIDTQVHFREPGLTHKEDIESGSRAALVGGLVGFFEMPNTTPPTATVADLKYKTDRAKETSWTQFAFFAGATPENISQLEELEKVPGCCGVKVFMGSSTGNLLIDKLDLLENVLLNTKRRVAVHCEDEERLKARWHVANEPGGEVKQHPHWRDEQTALIATQNLVTLAKKHNRKVHVLHVTTKQEMEFLAAQKEVASVECTPQHLTLSAPECYKMLGTKAQMNPPIRTKDHQDALWNAISQKVVDIIGSDHAPHTLEEKARRYPASPSGMVGVQTTVPIMLHHINNGRLTLLDLVRLMAENPCKLFGIRNKGYIKAGYDADFTIVDLNKLFTIKDSWIESKSQWTPFANMQIKGFVDTVIINGKVRLRDGRLKEKVPNSPFEFEIT